MRNIRTTTRVIAAASGAVLALVALSACSSSSDEASSAPSAAASGAAAAADDAMVTLCDQMVAEKMDVATATALAEDNGYVARVGSIDGEAQAVTMDLREDRFTFEVESDVVVGCTYG